MVKNASKKIGTTKNVIFKGLFLMIPWSLIMAFVVIVGTQIPQNGVGD
jgi:hypothetical protein